MARPGTAISDTFGLQRNDAEMLYYQLILVAFGLASTCTSGRSPLTIPQICEILGKNVRAFLMVIRAYILSHLKFSVAEQAVLLGISPTSVTKARQRLKAKMCILSQPFGMVLRYSYVTAPEKGKVEQVKKKDTMEDLFEALIPISICVVLPVLIVWLIGRVKQNETNRKAEIMLKALDNGAKIDTDFFKSSSGSKTIKERLLGRLTGACITSLLGITLTAAGIIIWHELSGRVSDVEDFLFLAVIGGILLAVGISLFIIYFSSKKMLSKEIAAEEKQLTEGK